MREARSPLYIEPWARVRMGGVRYDVVCATGFSEGIFINQELRVRDAMLESETGHWCTLYLMPTASKRAHRSIRWHK